MITFLRGILVEKQPTRIVLDVGGVGYEVAIPLSSYDQLPVVGEECKILTHDHIREDAHLLFGFMYDGLVFITDPQPLNMYVDFIDWQPQ